MNNSIKHHDYSLDSSKSAIKLLENAIERKGIQTHIIYGWKTSWLSLIVHHIVTLKFQVLSAVKILRFLNEWNVSEQTDLISKTKNFADTLATAEKVKQKLYINTNSLLAIFI